jgi:hypothetical protein
MTDARKEDAEETARSSFGPADEEFANAYADGYGEGLREAFREVLQHASRGHTAQELRILVESRVARLREDVEVKRRSLLGPPRRPAWGPLLRPPVPGPSPSTWVGPPPVDDARPRGAGGTMEVLPGTSVLLREERPQRAVDLVVENLSRFPSVLWVSVRPASDARLPREKLRHLRVTRTSGGAGTAEGGVGPSEVAGQVREAAKAEGGVLVYFDALEFIASEYGVEATIRLTNFLAGVMRETNSALVVSADPKALDARDQSRIQKAFDLVA